MSGDKASFEWFESSHSAGGGGECVEVATGSGALFVRDSKHTAGPMVSLTPEARTEFLGFAARHTA
ncbi:DUF397 domain-containing protein [Streptomyces sp. NPDC020731]|uniref:DUF397 domain-containing protein n=1 Tax=Streptomyces sp. NPDC020731 TaxID=3365085 RepID=UPI00378A40BD